MFKRSKYNYPFRLRCVEAVVKGKRLIGEVASEKGIEDSNLRLWIGFYNKLDKSGVDRI